MSDCIFCKIIAREIPADIVFEDDKLLVFKDIHPKAPTHLLLVPKQHVDSLAELTEKESELAAHLMLSLPRVAKQVGLKGFRTVINTGAEGGQIVFHLHAHLLGGALKAF
ncbi:MAG: histidine triad nucleotide-binding protein [Gammaproteobacteria bacterium]